MVVAALAVVAVMTATSDIARADEPPQFDSDVAPLLARRCLECHGGATKNGGLDLTSLKSVLKGGESGAALVAGKPDASLLLRRVRDGEMPPKKPLSAAEKATFERWIAAGAAWGTDPIDPFAFSSDGRAGYDWWSLQPLRNVAVPPVDPSSKDAAWPRTPIDRFILAKLREKELSPAPEADRRTLLRRLSFDLRGLPPSPEELDAIERDDSPEAIDRLVDRLLASPHYGERWGRHWLDVVRFGESHGFERDKLRPHSWRYRDQVIRAFNDDLPYDEFARRQLAGDALRPDDPSAVAATGFLVAGPYDDVGQSQQSVAMKKVVQQDELEDLLGSVGQTFLGLTVNCARCHDHKFDPIRQVDYYRMGAALGGVRHGERGLPGAEPQRESADLVAGYSAKYDELQTRRRHIEESARRAILAERKEKPATAKPPVPFARWEFDGDGRAVITWPEDTDRGGEKTTLDVALKDGATFADGRLLLDGKGWATTGPLPRDLRAKTLEAWVRLADLEQRGGGVIGVQTLDGATFDAIVFGEREPGRWMAGSNFFLRTENLGGPAETEATKQAVHIAVVYHADGIIAAYRDGLPYGKPYLSKGVQKFSANEAQVVFGLRHAPPGGNKHLKGVIERASLYDRALTPDEVAASAGVSADFVSAEAIAERLSPEQKADRDRLVAEMNQLERLRNRAAATTVYAALSATPPVTHVLHRGNPAAPGEPVTPGGIAALRAAPADFQLPADAPEPARRQALAAWITDRRQALFARVIVNRLWHHHFGVGLVDTCNDFGFNGGRPSHPELLDWLAGELVRHDFRLKPVQRLIVQSAVYRQSSRERPDAAAVDAGNRLLWRRTPHRLEAEAVRDAMLSAAGELNVALGGPGYEDFTTFTANSQFYVMQDAVGATFQRRSVYRTWVRSGRSPFLDVFDCPDPSTLTPQRAVTTTPLQALSLLNNSFVLRTADRLAARLAREAGSDPRRQADRGCRLLFGRPASPDEADLLAKFVADHGLPALCRVWLNSSEFLYVD